jgi:hypothetical protein
MLLIQNSPLLILMENYSIIVLIIIIYNIKRRISTNLFIKIINYYSSHIVIFIKIFDIRKYPHYTTTNNITAY